MAHIPDDVLIQIFTFLPAREILQLQALNSYWKNQITDSTSAINQFVDGRWSPMYDRMLKQTTEWFETPEVMEWSRCLLLSELHSDCTFSGTLYQSITKSNPDEDNESDNEEPIEESSRKRQRLASKDHNARHYQAPTLREALEDHLHKIFTRLTTPTLEPGVIRSPETILSGAKKMLQQMSTAAVRVVLSSPYVTVPEGVQLSNIFEDSSEVSRGQDSAANNEVDSTVAEWKPEHMFVGDGWFGGTHSWQDAIPYAMGAESGIIILHPILVNYKEELLVGRSSSKKIAQLLSQKSKLIHPFDLDSFFLSIDKSIEVAKEQEEKLRDNNADELLKFVSRLLPFPEGVAKLPLTLGELKVQEEIFNQLPKDQLDNFEGDFSENRRYVRHCAECYVPQWLVSALERIGKVVFIEATSCISCEASFYFLLAERTPYAVGLFWMKDLEP